jgi:hypothetical protein
VDVIGLQQLSRDFMTGRVPKDWRIKLCALGLLGDLFSSSLERVTLHDIQIIAITECGICSECIAGFLFHASSAPSCSQWHNPVNILWLRHRSPTQIFSSRLNNYIHKISSPQSIIWIDFHSLFFLPLFDHVCVKSMLNHN